MKRTPLFYACMILSALLICTTACHKSTSSSSSNSATVTLMTANPWMYDTAGIDYNKDGIIDIGDGSSFPACVRDNTYTFYKDSTGVMNEGALKCNSTDPQTVNFTWSVSGSNPQVLKSNADSLLATGVNIYSLTSTQLKLYKDTSYLGASLYYIVQFKH